MTKETSKTYDSTNPLKNKPVTGPSGSDPSTSLYVPGKVSTSSNPSESSTTKPLDIETRRMGDWYVDNGGILRVVPNSETDYTIKYNSVNGKSPLGKMGLEDYMDVIMSTGVNAMQGASVGKSIAESAGDPTGFASNVLALGGGVVGGLLGWKSKENEIKNRYLKDYLDQEFTVTPAYHVVEDKDGKKKVYLDKDIAASAGYGSGSELLKLSDGREKTGATIGSDGSLNVKVTSLYAMSDEYLDLTRKLKEYFPNGISEEMANRVIDENTGTTLQQYLDAIVKEGETNFYYYAKSIAEFKVKAPTASNESLLQACNTQASGMWSKDEMNRVKIVVYDLDNEKKELTAREYFDEISSKSADDRNAYMSEIGNKILSPDISDDEKAILQGQANALYAASNVEGGEYEGMYKKNFFDTVLGTFMEPTFGTKAGNVLDFFGVDTNYDLETFEEDAAGRIAGKLGTFALDIGERKIFNKVADKVIPASFRAVGKAFGDSPIGRYLENFGTIAAGAGKTVGFDSKAAMIASRFVHEVATDALRDTIRYGAHSIAGNEYDFWKELYEDVAMDILLTRGPEAYVQVLNGNTWRWERVATKDGTSPDEEVVEGEVLGEGSGSIPSKRSKKEQKIKEAETRPSTNAVGFPAREARITSEELVYDSGDKAVYDEATQSYEVRLVEKTSKELSAKRSKTIVERNLNNNWAIAVHELFHDRNYAIGELGYHIVNTLSGGQDEDLKYRIYEAGHTTREQRDKMTSEFLNRPSAKTLQTTFSNQLLDLTGGKAKNLSKEDRQYIIAKAQRHRFMGIFKGDKKNQMRVLDQYNPYIKKIDKSRAKKLDDLMDTMVAFGEEFNKFAVEKGWRTQELVDKFKNSNDKFIPVRSTKHKYNGGTIGTYRRDVRELRNEKALYPVEDMDDPIDSLFKDMAALMQDIAKNDAALAIIQEASIPGNPGIHIVSDRIVDDGGSLEKTDDSELLTRETEMMHKYSGEFDKGYNKIVAKVEKEVPTEEAWREDNKKAVENSAAWGSIFKIVNLKGEQKELTDEYVKALRIVNGDFDDKNISDEALDRAFEDYDYYRYELASNKKEQQKAIEKFILDTTALMKKQAAKHSYSPIELDIDSYVAVYLRDKVNKILEDPSGNGAGGKLIEILNEAVELANPYDVTREQIIKQRAGKLAERMRKKIAKDTELTNRIRQQRTLRGKKNQVGNVAYDVACKVVSAFKRKIGVNDREDDAIDYSNDGTFFSKNNNRPANAIDVRIEGKTHRVTFGGPLAEIIPREFYASEGPWNPESTIGKITNAALVKPSKFVARTARTLLTSINPTRPLINLARDRHRAFTATGGLSAMNPDYMRQQAYNAYADSPEARKAINDGWMLARENIEKSTFTQSFEEGEKNVAKRIIKNAKETSTGETLFEHKLAREEMSLREQIKDIPNYLKKGFIHYKVKISQKNWVELLSFLNDAAEASTRKRVMDNAYFQGIIDASKQGLSPEEAVELATRKAYFYGKEATTNFARRGKFIGVLAQYVPYLSQGFASQRSLQLTYVENPIGFTRALESTIAAYSSLLVLTLSNEESRKKYFLLSDFERANSFIIPLTNDMIITIRMDETLMPFFQPFRRMIEYLQGVDQTSFYLTFMDVLDAVSGFDLSGFSEGDKFNLQRGFEKLGAQNIPIILQPFVENSLGKDLYYGTDISVDESYTSIYGIYNPTPGQLTKKSKNSKLLAMLADATGIPQWKIQNVIASYGGDSTVGRLVLSIVDKLIGGTEEGRGSEDWINSVFAPFCGGSQNAADNAMLAGINQLQKEKAKLKGDVKTINDKIEAAAGEEKAELIKKRQKMIREYGIRVTDFLRSYLSAYEITGGLSKQQANRVWYLFDISGEEDNAAFYAEDSLEKYYNDKIRDRAKERQQTLAVISGYSDFVNPALRPFYQSYGLDALKKSINGYNKDTMAKIALVLENTDNYDNSFTKLRSDMVKKRSKAFEMGDYDTANALAYEYDLKVLRAIYPILKEADIELSLKNDETISDYLEPWIYVPTDYYKTANGRWLSKLPAYVDKKDAYRRRFILEAYGLLEEDE